MEHCKTYPSYKASPGASKSKDAQVALLKKKGPFYTWKLSERGKVTIFIICTTEYNQLAKHLPQSTLHRIFAETPQKVF